MAEPLEETYLYWLCARVVNDMDQPIYHDLLTMLHHYEFIPVHSGDHNRAGDGLDLRQQFLREAHHGPPPEWDGIGCSVLEMLISFAEVRAAWATSSPAREWFWKMIENLKLEDYRRVNPDDVPDIEEILYTFVWRLYDDNGNGGLFPMRYSQFDQTRTEIWYQFCEYVEENQLV